MGSKKTEKAPEYTTSSYSTGGLFGSAVATPMGVMFSPNSQMTNAGNSAWKGLQTNLESLNSGDFSKDPNYQVYAKRLQDQMTQNYDASVLSPLANRGLMRSSGLQGATNAFNDTLANQTTNLYDSYYNRLSNNLANNQNVLSNLYNYLTGANTGAQNQANNVSQYNLSRVQADNQINAQNNAQNNAMFGQLAQAGAGIAAAALM